MSDREGVSEMAREAKQCLGSKKASFKRKHKVFHSLVKAEGREDIVKEAYKALG